MIKITAVSYINTWPFIHGIEHSGFLKDYTLSLLPPAQCASALLNNNTDIALVPVTTLLKLPTYTIQTNYCIGAQGKVNSVLLLSRIPLNEIKTIGLDTDSNTSVQLLKILSEKFWKIPFETYALDFSQSISPTTPETILCIGDKAMTLASQYPYKYDLAEEWQRFTGLPFVFACWVSTNYLPTETLNDFNNAIAWGIGRIEEAIHEYKKIATLNIDFTRYLKEDISYPFDAEKQKALQTFLDYIK